MNYYKHHIGDYRRDTSHLTLIEHGAYRQMLDMYYLNEQPLPTDMAVLFRKLCARSEDEKQAVQTVIAEFFEETETGWQHKRCDDEIAHYCVQADASRTNGKLGGRPKKSETEPNGNLPGFALEPEKTLTTNQEPLTTNQYKEGKPSLSATAFPPCPHKLILDLWKKHLPQLSQPRVWEGSRQANLRQRWVQAGKPSAYSPKGYRSLQEGLEWWDGFLGYIAQDTKLADGFETGGRVWRPDFEWVVNATNFQKIIDGKYNK